MTEIVSLELLPVALLIRQAHQEIQYLLRHQPMEGAHAFELFRRALVVQDELAWSGLYELYHGLVSSWVLRRTRGWYGDDQELLVNEVFAKFSRSMNPQKLEHFGSVSAILAYLRCCAGSVVVDHHRSQQARLREEPLASIDQEPLLEDPAEVVATQLATQEVWQVMNREVTRWEERLILRAVCALGLSPRELQQRYPLVFPTVADIYRIKRKMLERLRRNRALQALLHGEASSPVKRRML
jgi:DNA-directed RNA polymerase specialized sigma24 family protein